VTRARAPGKLVLSGAYAVLSGAPAIVTTAGRYVTADASRPAELVTDEVAAALAGGDHAPWFDASELREGGRKLGLGSSAAILLASLFARERQSGSLETDAELRARLFPRALEAHQRAQAGGSGVDVAASCFGGTLVYRVGAALPDWRAVTLPSELVLEVWVCPTSASTRELIAGVGALALRDSALHARLLGAQASASVEAVAALDSADARAFIRALSAQHAALAALGAAAGVPIVTPELGALRAAAEAQGGALLPAGAGGGDIAIFAGLAPSSAALRGELRARAHRLLDVPLAVAGVGTAP
jgi:phosphomevalonate kinase